MPLFGATDLPPMKSSYFLRSGTGVVSGAGAYSQADPNSRRGEVFFFFAVLRGLVVERFAMGWLV